MKTELSIQEFLSAYTLHDSNILSTEITWDGSVLLEIQFDEVWNAKNLEPIDRVRFNDVYGIVEFKIDRVNIVGTVTSALIENYDRDFVAHTRMDGLVYVIDFEFIAGGRLTIICEDSIKLLLRGHL